MEQTSPKAEPHATEIDLVELCRAVWRRRGFVLKTAAVFLGFAIIYYISVPNRYSSSAAIMTESQDKNLSGMGGVAAMMGINLSSGPAGADAITAEQFPEIVQTRPMLAKFLDMQVELTPRIENGVIVAPGEQITLLEYLVNRWKFPWYSYILKPFQGRRHEITPRDYVYDTAVITPVQGLFFARLGQSIAVKVDKKGPTRISVTTQNPMVSYMLEKRLLTELEAYITEYRTLKARRTLEFSLSQADSARAKYDAAARRLAVFEDNNRSLVSARAEVERQRLESEFTIAGNIYSNIMTQTEMARLELQKSMPVYAALEPASYAAWPVAPRLVFSCAVGIFLGIFFAVCWVIVRHFTKPSPVPETSGEA